MEKSIQVDGLKVRYLEEGSGPAVVLLHGASLGSSADVWDGTLGSLAQGGFRGLAFDRPGYGHSDNPRDFTASYQEAFILKFMDALELRQPCLVGHSGTGVTVVQLALEHPNQFSKVVTVGTGSLLPPLPEQGGRGQGREEEEGGGSEPTLEDTRKVLEGNLFNKSLITPEVLEKRHRMSVGKNFQASIERSKAREPRRNEVPLWKRLEEVQVPYMMIMGKEQVRGSAGKRCALLIQKEPSFRVELIENCAHLVMWDAKEIFCQKVLEFLHE